MSNQPERGKFITFEGLDGCGKSTQLEKLAAVLRGDGIEVLDHARAGRNRDWRAHSRRAAGFAHCRPRSLAEMALMFASRAQQLAQVILPALESGQWVLCDRFTDSTEAYQGGGRKLGSDAVLQLHKVLCRGFWPDLTILMDSDVEHSVKRARRRNKVATDGALPDENRFEQESYAFFTRVQEAFRASPSASRSGWQWWMRGGRLTWCIRRL